MPTGTSLRQTARAPSRPGPRDGPPRSEPLARLPSAARWALIAASGYYLLAYLVVALVRAGYPFELEWIEGASLVQVLRVLGGDSLYPPPSVAYVPLNYAPLYYWMAAPFAWVMGGDFHALRLVSFLSSLAVFGFLYDLVFREHRSHLGAMATVGFFAATFRLGGAWLDIARVDSLSLAFLLAGVWVLRIGKREAASGAAAGLLFVLAFMTKQSSATIVVPLVAWTLATRWRRGVALVVAGGAAGAIAVLATNAATGGWFGYYAFDIAKRHPIDLSLLPSFPTGNILRHFKPGLAVLAVSGFLYRRWWWSRPGGFHLALLAGLTGSSWLLRLYPGGYDNVLIPAHIAFSIAIGLTVSMVAAAKATETRSRLLLETCLYAAIVVQMGLVWWDPRKQVPTAEDRAAWIRLEDGLRAIPGEVLMPSHPYLALRIGKPAHAHVVPFMDVVKGAHGPVEAGLLGAMRQDLTDHRYSVVVLDTRDWLLEEALRARYKAQAQWLRGEGVGWTVTGMRTRPQWILMVAGQDSVTVR